MIQLNKASKSFKGNVAVQDLSFSVNGGETLGLLGTNGAGKSTTINLILGFLKPDSGTVHVKQLDVSQQGEEPRKHIGYLPALGLVGLHVYNQRYCQCVDEECCVDS